MDETAFWKLIDASRADGRGEFGAHAESLTRRLTKLPPAEIAAFDRIYRDHVAVAYSWDLWGAAYLINGGCSDDAFDYFRDWVISKGRTVYDAAVHEPDSLANVVTEADIEECCEFEELRYAASRAWEASAEGEMPSGDGDDQPAEPSGEPWDEDMAVLVKRFPNLAARFA
jgi:hypothetical protein